MKVCIAEKPSVAKEIANIVGAKDRKDGYFEGNGYAVTWTFGHFCTLYSPDDYNPSWKSWNLGSLPMLPERFETKLMDNGGVRKQFKVIQGLFKKASVVINCGDAGQEGELIQRWVLKEAKYTGQVLRLWISSLTPEAIKDGFQNLRDASNYDNLYYAGSSRAIGDWLLGMNATRLFTLRYGGYKQVLSIGRVQTPTLAMLVERYKEIENFSPEPFWELQTVYRETTFNCVQGKFQKKEDGQTLYDKILDKPFVITDVAQKNGKELPPRLFDLTGLQVYCNNKFGFSADHTLQVTQKLYEQKVVTYPRVDTTFLPDDVYPKIAGILQKLTNYNSYTQVLLGQPIRKSSKVFDNKKVTDHHAIIPTGYQQSLGKDEQTVYDIITRHFIAAFYPDCLVSNTTVLGESETVPFKTTGKEILDPGWRVVLQQNIVASNSKPSKTAKSSDDDADDSESKDEEKTLPNFVKDESGEHIPNLAEKQTQPPKLYSEATLLRAMETAGKQVDDDELRELMKANGIGRPSTRAAIIETLFSRKYIQRQKKLIVPTSIGVQLIDLIQNDLLKSAELTGQWEKNLKEIEQGTHHAGKFIKDMKSMVYNLVNEVKLDRNTVRIAAPIEEKKVAKTKVVANKTNSSASNTSSPKTTKSSKGILQQKCPKCQQGNLLQGNTNYGCDQWKEGCDFRLPFSFMDKKITEKQLITLITEGKTAVIKGFKSDNKKVSGILLLDAHSKIEFQQATAPPKAKIAKKEVASDDIPCPNCKKGKVIKGQKAYGCSSWQEGCTFRFSFEDIRNKAAGQALTKELVVQIIRGEL